MNLMDAMEFGEFDQLHYELENKLIVLVKSVQNKKQSVTWDNLVHEPNEDYGVME